MSRLEDVVSGLAPAERAGAARLAAHAAHELATPISTIVMEVYSARLLMARLKAGGHPAAVDPQAPIVTSLEAICGNLSDVAARLTEYVEALNRLGREPGSQEGGT